ncbi:MAG: GDSL-type esterase/lipase family protein [Verrucomicrobiota bacterium]
MALRFLTLCLIAAISTVSAAASGKPWRIMPIGDSITEGGSTFSVYRLPLLEKLRAAGYDIEYVGSRNSPSPYGPLRHEGYGGKNIEFISSVVPENFEKNPADIVLLHAGHNHTIDEKPIPGILSATEALIQSLRKSNPKVVVLLAQPITSGKLPKYAYLPALGKETSALAKRLNTPESPVISVDQACGFDFKTDTISDKVHPNATGANKMAQRWFEALTQVMGKP